MIFKIKAQVSGGVTGTRSAFLKKNGAEVEYTSREAAQAEADVLNRTLNRPESKARFCYTVVEVSEL